MPGVCALTVFVLGLQKCQQDPLSILWSLLQKSDALVYYLEEWINADSKDFQVAERIPMSIIKKLAENLSASSSPRKDVVRKKKQQPKPLVVARANKKVPTVYTKKTQQEEDVFHEFCDEEATEEEVRESDEEEKVHDDGDAVMQDATFVTAPAPATPRETKKKQKFTCGAPTHNNTECRRAVKLEGAHCRDHALVPEAKKKKSAAKKKTPKKERFTCGALTLNKTKCLRAVKAEGLCCPAHPKLVSAAEQKEEHEVEYDVDVDYHEHDHEEKVDEDEKPAALVFCPAIKSDGTRCRKRVKTEGECCSVHKKYNSKKPAVGVVLKKEKFQCAGFTKGNTQCHKYVKVDGDLCNVHSQKD